MAFEKRGAEDQRTPHVRYREDESADLHGTSVRLAQFIAGVTASRQRDGDTGQA